MEITTKLEFDAGHRIPNHKSICKNLHGHRYCIEVTIKGEINSDKLNSDFGMVIDFKDAKELIKKTIVDEWDHSFIVYKDDAIVLEFLKSLDNHKTVIFSLVPTAENMALYLIDEVCPMLLKDTGVSVNKIRLYETTNCYVEVTR